tara:strand:- start:3022 stop:3951 length:930 start_codon:yes stop_codon:yes gene_type:complete
MLNKNIRANDEEKYLCYCSRVTHEVFREHINKLYSKNLENLCDNLNVAKHCAACLPNVEDEFFNYKNKKINNKNVNFGIHNLTLKEKLKNLIDPLFGTEPANLEGHLPMLASKKIKTWLVVSNEKPSLINFKIVPYRIILNFYNNTGNKINSISAIVRPNNRYHICLNDYVSKSTNDLENYYVSVKRCPMSKGFRGSTRPHFYYEAPNSMASLHTQDSGRKLNVISLPSTTGKDRNILFVINFSKKNSFVEITSLDKFEILPMGSKIIDLNNLKGELNKGLLLCKSTIKVKCYLIIADKKLNNLSIDHL